VRLQDRELFWVTPSGENWARRLFT
jgi:hypothetical protein